MDKWEDTVIDKEQADKAWIDEWRVPFDEPPPHNEEGVMAICKAQAEISFKAGQESRCDWHKPLPIIISESFTEGKKAGIKEVVEWIELNGVTGYIFYEGHGDVAEWTYETKCDNNLKFDLGDWQAKKKEWDIEDLKELW